MKFDLKITGYKQAEINVKALEDRIGRGAMRGAMTKAARIVAAAARRNAPVGRTGALKKSIRAKVVTNTKKNEVVARVGPSRKAQGKDPKTGLVTRPARYAHLVEFGTASRGVYGEKGKTVTPGSPPKPFLRPAYESTRRQAVEVYKTNLGPEIQKTAARISKSAIARNARA